MATILFANNAVSTLASNISSGVTSLTLAAGTGTLFPSPTAGQYFLVTMIPVSTGIPGEIMQVTARSGDVLTIVRGQESTTPTAYTAGDSVSNQLTAGTMNAFIQSAVTNPNRIVTASTPITLLSTDNGGSVGFNRTTSVTPTTVTLPSGVSASYKVTICDLASNFNANPLTVNYPGGQVGPNSATTALLNVNKSRTTFEYFGTNQWSGP
jgi:hypothetical protein